MSSRAVALLFLLCFQLGGAIDQAESQDRYKIGGGAGFAVLKNPEIDHGRTAIVGGFLGLRFNDNLSLEGGFNFVRSNRVFDRFNEPVDESQALPAFRFETNRYHLDGTVVFHFGRRQPFHAFILGGGGIVRRDEKRTDVTFTFDPDDDSIIDQMEEVVLDDTEYELTAHVGAGFDLYFMYNLAARVEFRQYLPQTYDKRTRAFIFGATYFF